MDKSLQRISNKKIKLSYGFECKCITILNVKKTVVLFCISVTCAFSFGAVPFEPLRHYQTGLYSTGVLPADVDGDGDIDLIIANRGTNDVSVMYNEGNGIFRNRTNFPTGVNPRYVHGADFDGDGDIDLCTPDFTGMTETVLENDGTGAFTIIAQFPLVTPAFSWVDDIDSDGFPDILVTHWDGDASPPSQNPAKFTPLINNGDGTFVVYPSSRIGVQPRGGASADLNGDGIKDVVVANYVSSSLSIVMGLGKRQWADEISIQLTGAPRYVALGDFDNDSDVDIAAVDKNDDQLWIFHNDGLANFTLVATWPTNLIPHSIDAGDVDLDGDLDLIVSHVGAPQQLLFINEGGGQFSTVETVLMGGGTAEVKFADVNNDGNLDIVTANVNWEEKGLGVRMQGLCDGFDCNGNEIGDICELPDCNLNGVPDDCDVTSGYSVDLNNDGVPDECQVDCNGNGIPDDFEVAQGMVGDCNSNLIPDDCDWIVMGDCDGDGVIDGCEVDDNWDWIPDECQCVEDFTFDGTVAVHDLLQLVAAWGESPNPHGEPVVEDLNRDSEVDVHDLLILIGAWGDCPKATIPNVFGVCCIPMSACLEITATACYNRNGTYLGDNTSCVDLVCEFP